MEQHQEARTPGDPVAWLPGTLRSQTPEEEEPRVGGSAPAASVLDAEAYGASADGLWELPVEPAERMVTILLSIVTKFQSMFPAPDGQTRKIPHCFDLYFFD